jgi:hypothetical protein
MYRASHPRLDPTFILEMAVPRVRKRGEGLDLQRRQNTADILCEARCPCCRTPLVARMGRHGPYFHCLCSERQPGRATDTVQ